MTLFVFMGVCMYFPPNELEQNQDAKNSLQNQMEGLLYLLPAWEFICKAWNEGMVSPQPGMLTCPEEPGPILDASMSKGYNSKSTQGPQETTQERQRLPGAESAQNGRLPAVLGLQGRAGEGPCRKGLCLFPSHPSGRQAAHGCSSKRPAPPCLFIQGAPSQLLEGCQAPGPVVGIESPSPLGLTLL